MKKILVITLVLVLFVAGCSGGQNKPAPTPSADQIIPPVVSASGKLLPAKWANLASQTGGRVVEVKVQAGDKVQAGQVLVQLDDVDAKLSLAQAQAALKTAQAQLVQLKAGARPAEIAAAEQGVKEAEAAASAAAAQLAQLQAGTRAADIAAAAAEVTRLAAELDRAQKAYNGVVAGRAEAKEYGIQAGGLGQAEEQMRAQLAAIRASYDAAQKRVEQLKAGPTLNELNVARANLAAAEAGKARAQAQLDLLKAGATQEQIAVAEASVAQAQVAVDLAQAALDKLQLKAPFAGTVGNVYARVGEMLTPGQTVLALGDLTGMRVETTDLSEVDVARVTVGQPVNVTFDAIKGKTLTGKVTRIAPMSSQGQGGVNYSVIVELDQLDPALRWGMTAFTDIQVK
jgi:multidrug efflux pump subunit AcrA (membrane-fusion protein)